MGFVRGLLFALLPVASAAKVAGAPPTLARNPTAARHGDKVKIVFAVSRETDVAAYVKNVKDEIVRHLDEDATCPKR